MSAEIPFPEIDHTEEVDVGDAKLNEFLRARNARYVEPYTVPKGPLYDDDDNEIIPPPRIIRYDLHEDMSQLDELPQGYFYMGGTARNVVLDSYGEEVDAPRDYDLVGILELGANYKLRKELTAKYMADDAKVSEHYGVKVELMGDYFATRDFTVNEVITDGKQVWATPEALKDLMTKTVRISAEEKDYLDKHPKWGGKIIMKALRLFLQMKDVYGSAHLESLADWHFADEQRVSPFHILLQLDKAVTNGDLVAEEFARVILDLSQIEPIRSTKQAVDLPNASRLALSIVGDVKNFTIKSPLLRAAMLDYRAAVKYDNVTDLAQQCLKKIKHLEDWREEVV